MKRLLAIAMLLGLVLTGCAAKTETTAPTTAATTAATEAPTASGKIEVNSEGIYRQGVHLFDHLYPMKEDSVKKLAEKVNSIKDTYLTEGNRVFMSLIPDKSYFSDTDENIDHYKMAEIVESGLDGIEYIEIGNLLELEDYYRTDGHWKQENIFDIANKLGEKLGFTVDENSFVPKKLENYLGMYYPISDKTADSEVLTYLESDATKSAVVDNFQKKDFTQVYDEELLTSPTPYDVFLSGPTPFQTITNPNAGTDKELVIFRDSFTSSLAPLMIEHYSKITLIDLRYMASQLLPEFVTFENQDVLFLYSAAVANQSIMLK